MLSALSLVNNKVQEFDATNAKTLAELEQVRVRACRTEPFARSCLDPGLRCRRRQQKEQLRFIEWFQKWSKVSARWRAPKHPLSHA